MNFRDLKLRLRALFAPRRVERELDDELAFHVEREAAKHVMSGARPEEARRRALARFGSVTVAADECRDARGVAFVDGAIRDVSFAWRSFRRAPLAALTIVTTVALGLGLVAVVFTILNELLFRVDRVPNPHELFAVERPRLANGEPARFTRPEYEAFRRENAIFADVSAMLEDIDLRVDGRMMSVTLVTGNFFQTTGVRAAIGRPLASDDEDRGGRQVAVLSHRGWSRLFSNDAGVIGRQLLVNGQPFEIVGVMPEGFRGLSVGAPDFWAPLTLLGRFRLFHAGREDRVRIDIVGRLKPGLARRQALAGLAVWDAARAGGDAAVRVSGSLTLQPRQGTIPHPAEALLVFTPLFFAFGLILLIGCANVANLLLARGVARQREIGIRLSLGASRPRIIRQLLTESLLLALAAAAFGFFISRVVLNVTINTVMSSVAPEFADDVRLSVPDADWRVALFLAGGAAAATVFFGLLPALQATRLELLRTIRGEVMRDARPGRARSILVGIQVTASALLLISASIFLRSSLASATHDPGFRTADTLIVEIVNEPLRAAMVRAVTSEPAVAALAASWPNHLDRPRGANASGAGGASSAVAYRCVSANFFSVLGIDVLRGRTFTESESVGTAAVAILSETAARQLWPDGNAVGQVMSLDPDSSARPADDPGLPSRTFTVVGVVRDVPGFRIAVYQEAGVYVPASLATPKTSLAVRVHGDPDQARRSLLQRLTAIDPNMGQVVTMRTLEGLETYFLRLVFWLTLVLGGLALALTLSGLFSVLSYLVAQRTKEIGVRMTLGATAGNVGGLMFRQLVRPVSLGLAVGGGLATALGIALMATPAGATIGRSVRVLDPVAYAASLFCIVTACALAAAIPARRASRVDPIAALRQD